MRVHEHLLSRGDLSREDRDRAQHALALDFLKAGLLDRAEDALRKLEGTAHEAQALLALLAIYERTRDWQAASDTARKLASSGNGDFSGRLAHYLCEQAAEAPPAQAEALLREAQSIAPNTARPGLDLAALQQRAGDPSTALATLSALAQDVPLAMGLIARPLAEAALACHREAQARALLETSLTQSPSLDVMDALALLAPTDQARREAYLHQLHREPSLVAASRWLADEPLAAAEVKPLVQRALDHAAKPLSRYRCAACGFEANRHFWQCPGCQAWDSYPARRVEEL